MSDLESVLRQLGVDIRRADGKEITGRCPVHLRVTGKEDNSPSWSMNASSGLWICFSCGARGTLSMLVEELAGSSDAMATVRELSFKVATERAYGQVPIKASAPDVDWLTFSRFDRVPEQHLSNRNIDIDISNRYGIRWCAEHKYWIIPIISPEGELMGWQEKSRRFFRNVPEGVQKSQSLFGWDRFTAKTAVLVESPLDVVRFATVFDSPQALATFGAHVSADQLELVGMAADRLIIAMDNDPAGLAAAKHIYKNSPRFKKGVFFFNYGNTDAKDIGEMTDSQIVRGIKSSTSTPPWKLVTA